MTGGVRKRTVDPETAVTTIPTSPTRVLGKLPSPVCSLCSHHSVLTGSLWKKRGKIYREETVQPLHQAGKEGVSSRVCLEGRGDFPRVGLA